MHKYALCGIDYRTERIKIISKTSELKTTKGNFLMLLANMKEVPTPGLKLHLVKDFFLLSLPFLIYIFSLFVFVIHPSLFASSLPFFVSPLGPFSFLFTLFSFLPTVPYFLLFPFIYFFFLSFYNLKHEKLYKIRDFHRTVNLNCNVLHH